MNKLAALYELMKNMKEMDCPDAQMSSELKFGEAVIAKGMAESKSEAGKNIRRLQINFGEETIKVEKSGSLGSRCAGGGFGPHGIRGMHKCMAEGFKGHAECHTGKKGGRLSRAMMLIKLLDKTVYDEKAKTFSLDLSFSDMPESFKAQFNQHLSFKKEHMKAMQSNCDDVNFKCDEHHQKVFKHLIDAGIKEVDLDSVEPSKIRLLINTDESLKPMGIKFDVLVGAKLNSGDECPMHFSLDGKML